MDPPICNTGTQNGQVGACITNILLNNGAIKKAGLPSPGNLPFQLTGVAIRQVIGEPDLFRMQYRQEIKYIVAKIVLDGMNKTQATYALRGKAHEIIPLHDQPRFVETIERELLSLHEGNVARYQLRLNEYEDWKKNWS
jgi:hypothetical protein